LIRPISARFFFRESSDFPFHSDFT
jgi:hypothetical protein